MNLDRTIPGHLRRFVVRQDYDKYTEEDQAVWRFVVLQTHARLLKTAHEAYSHGFSAAGISVERIPRIDEMNEKLGRFGWGAVCVDGFIPPRAFQAFQARGILPIAADIRTSKHLTYTPAPDIIHEAAGHAPFLAEPRFARYVRRIGEVARRAFASPPDRAVYEAIYTLSELKEDPASTTSQIRRAEEALGAASALVTVASESAKIARLYWWTAEYGLVGTPSDFRLYGAGLLSSIGEGHFCELPGVRKIPLTSACVDVDYDVTRAQPQLFVAKSFGDLEDVLDAVDSTLSYRRGGRIALGTAVQSAEVATVVLDSAAEVIGVVSRVEEHAGQTCLVELTGATAVGLEGALLDGLPRRTGYLLPVGTLDSGVPLSALTPDSLPRYANAGRLVLRLASRITVSGQVRSVVPADGRICALLLADFELSQGDQVLARADLYPLALAGAVTTAWAGAPDAFFPVSAVSSTSVPKTRTFSEAELDMIGLYDRAIEAFKDAGGRSVGDAVGAIVERLDDAFPDEWLLRWNLLESLVKIGERPDLSRRLERDLERLELRYDHLEPIATGLAYVRSLLAPSESRDRASAG
jgi:phenylalanine-4-hydroxylase